MKDFEPPEELTSHLESFSADSSEDFTLDPLKLILAEPIPPGASMGTVQQGKLFSECAIRSMLTFCGAPETEFQNVSTLTFPQLSRSRLEQALQDEYFQRIGEIDGEPGRLIEEVRPERGLRNMAIPITHAIAQSHVGEPITLNVSNFWSEDVPSLNRPLGHVPFVQVTDRRITSLSPYVFRTDSICMAALNWNIKIDAIEDVDIFWPRRATVLVTGITRQGANPHLVKELAQFNALWYAMAHKRLLLHYYKEVREVFEEAKGWDRVEKIIGLNDIIPADVQIQADRTLDDLCAFIYLHAGVDDPVWGGESGLTPFLQDALDWIDYGVPLPDEHKTNI